MQIAILLYHRFTALDAVGPYQVLSLLPGAEVLFVAAQPGPVADYWGSCNWPSAPRSATCPARTSCWYPAAPARTST